MKTFLDPVTAAKIEMHCGDPKPVWDPRNPIPLPGKVWDARNPIPLCLHHLRNIWRRVERMVWVVVRVLSGDRGGLCDIVWCERASYGKHVV